jgi:serine/threonine-protein kinase
MSNCFAEEVLRRYLEQQLSTEEASALETHVEACSHCEAALARLADVAEARQPWLFDAGGTPAKAPERPDAGAVDPGADTGPHTGWSDADTAWVVALLEQDGRYQVDQEIGRGGMGVVLKGRDLRLGRDLAFKVLRQELRGQKAIEQRFVREAQVCSQLQHPGIVPVYETGYLADGLPYFTMKLVEGQTLAKLLQQRTQVGEDLDRWLQVFVQVCLAVARAHSKGVLHRDLKPSNIMVGAFGEVQVMDWGMAKIRDLAAGHLPADPEAETVERPVELARPAEATRTGMQMGTLAYMAPEQARGEVDRLDARCDVFGLGAILCEILTGAPPYRGPRKVVEQRAVAADLSEAWSRLDESGADPELVGLARRCLAVEPGDRPAEAGAVARAVNVYLSGVQERLRRTELERAAAAAQAAAERKRRRVQLILAAAVLFLVVGGSSVVWLWQQRRQATDRAVEMAMSEARLLRGQALGAPLGDGAKFRAAHAAARKAAELARTGGASASVRQEAETLETELQGEAGAADADRRLLAALLEVRGPREGPRYRTDEQGALAELAEPSADEQFAAAFRAWGLEVNQAPIADAARRLGARPRAVVTEVIAALDEWAGELRRPEVQGDWQRLVNLAQVLAGETDPRRDELRALLGRGRLPLERALGVLGVALRPVPVPFDAGLGPDRGRLRQLAEQTNAETEPVLALLTLTRALRLAGDDALAERLLRAALWSRPQEVVLHDALGKLLEEQTPPRRAEAVECYATARALRPELGVALARSLVDSGRVGDGLALYQRLATEKRENPWLHLVIGIALRGQGRDKEAEAAFRAAIRLKPDYHLAHGNLGSALHTQGRSKEAEAAIREALRLKPDYHQAHSNLGVVLNSQGRHQEAEAACRKAIKLQPDYPNAYNNLGQALHPQDRHQEAEAEFRKAIRLKPDYPLAHRNLGAALLAQGRSKEAEAAFREALRLKPDYHQAHSNLGVVLNNQGRHQEAEAACRKAIKLQPDYPEAHNNLGTALAGQRRWKQAEAAFREAIRLKPDYHQAHDNLGNALGNQGRDKEAEGACRKAIELQPNYQRAHSNLGTALGRQGRFKEAEAAFREVIRLEPTNAPAYADLGKALAGQRRWKEAEAAFREAIRLKPDYHMAHDDLGGVLHKQGRYKEAEAAFREAIRLKPDYHVTHDNLGGVLHKQGRYKEAEAACRKAIKLQPDYPKAHSNLGLALARQGRLTEAEAAFREAIRLKPGDHVAHGNLGIVLAGQARFQEAEAACRKAIELQPKYQPAHSTLGNALAGQRRYKEAEAAYREAIGLKIDDAEAHKNLGNTLNELGRFKEAEAAGRKAIELQPKNHWAHFTLGNALAGQRRLKEAEAAFREAIRLQPDSPEPYFNLSLALLDLGRFKEAETAFREAIQRNPDFVPAHGGLGLALRNQGRFKDALAAFQRGHELGLKNPAWRLPYAESVRQCQRLIDLDRKLPGVRAGEIQPADAAEQLELAWLCRQPFKRFYATSARFYADAFAADSKLAADLRQQHRFHAARAAALAATGQGEDAKNLPEKVTRTLRQQVLTWLSADLAAYRKLVEGDKAAAKQAVRQRLESWQKDAALAGVRDKAALAKLADAERQAWEQLWADVAALLKRAQPKPVQP